MARESRLFQAVRHEQDTSAPLSASDRVDLARAVGRIERDCHAADPENAQIRRHPSGVVGGQDRHPITTVEPAVSRSQAANRGQSLQIGVETVERPASAADSRSPAGRRSVRPRAIRS